MRILILGGSSSVGRALAQGFAHRGDDVLATYAHDDGAMPTGVQALHLDLERPEDFAQFRVDTQRILGAIDHFILLAGTLPGKALADYPFELMQSTMAVNFTAQAALVNELTQAMAPGGSILAMSSIAAERGSFDPIYAASKAAVVAFIKSQAMWQGKNIRFNGIAPGLIQDSTMYNSMSSDRRAVHVNQTPTGELLRIEDLVQVIIDLTQPHWRHLNGALISLNGGRSTN